ncbi:unnamed protein product [Effrenium voratum]|nr:unnamed protein product [Effrenium voratum]
MLGFQEGNPTKLYAPRDYAGSYCGVDSNWQTGYNLNGFPSLSFTMNVTATTDLIVKELICSAAARDALTSGTTPLLSTFEARQAYLCDCCLSPCEKCSGSYKTDKLDGSNVQGAISGKMSELTGGANSLFDPSGANGDFFTNIWSQATKYFNMVCLTSCDVNFESVNSSSRSWTYEMAPDNPLASYWALLKASGPTAIKDTISSSFTFKALPTSVCNYPDSKCVPMPGVKFSETVPGYCSFGMTEVVTKQLGSAMSEAFGSISTEAFQNQLADFQNFGTLFGEAIKTADTFALTAVSCLIIAFVYLILLRFLLGTCVWTALLAVLVLLLFGGGLLFARASQCQGAELFDTGFQMVVATATYVQHHATSTLQQAVDPNSYEVFSEELVGDGYNYTGAQLRTVDGYTCIPWGTNNTDAEYYTQETFPNNDLRGSYCRNPYDASSATADSKARTIWCFTSDTQVTWQECRPIGVIRPPCQNGYAVSDETIRLVMEYCGYAVWVMGLLYLFLILCFCSRIREAIAINKVAAMFVASNPTVVVVPIVQAVLAVAWIGIWVFCASFLLSQVPADYTPTGAYATYAEAYGTSTTPGQCTGKWPTGFVYKDEDNCEMSNGTAMCWKCAQPRYAFDWRFACSFFMLLWNNAFNIACGQFIVAAAAATWFFKPNEEKGKKGVTGQAVGIAFRYHLGSLAFGSFVIAVVQFIRYVMMYLEKQAQAQKNKVVAMVLKLLQCCLWCLEKFLKFVSKNAYIQIAIEGFNFCTAAQKAFYLILSNALRFGAVALLLSVINLVGYLFIIAATVAVGYLQLINMHPDASPIIPIVMYVVCGYTVSHLCMNIYGLAASTFQQCFLLCEENKEKIEGQHDFIPAQMLSMLQLEPLEDEEPREKDKE